MDFFKKVFGENVTWRDVNQILHSDPNTVAKKWIYVYYSIYFSNDNDKRSIKHAAADMTLIINTTKAMFSGEMEEFMGCINPHLGIDSILVQESTQKPLIMINLEKTFRYSIIELPKQYQIVIQPFKSNTDEIDFYSLERLCFDMYMLGHASDFISKRYPIKVYNTTQSTFNPEMMKDEQGIDVPLLAHFIRLLVYRYSIKERFEFQKNNSMLDTWLFGAGQETFYDQIERIRNNQPLSEWTKKVNELIDDTKK